MFKALTNRLRRKTSSAIGLPNIYGRLDYAESQLRLLQNAPDPLDQVADYLFLLEIRLKDHQDLIVSDALSATNDRLELLANEIQDLYRKLAESDRVVNRWVNEVHIRVNDVQEALLEHVQLRSDQVSALASNSSLELHRRLDGLSDTLRQIINELKDVRYSVVSQPSKTPAIGAQTIHETPTDPVLYVRFEDRYRGTEQSIVERQSDYVSLLREYLEIGRVLDVGCGRGEWLEVLRHSNFDAYGIDSNPIAIERCKSKGLEVQLEDASEHLTKMPSESLGVVSLFQVLEHIPLNSLPNLLREIHRVLKPGGAVVAEFPNVQSLSVGGNTFWLDPTHLRPLHPLFVEFVAEEVGFTSTRLHYPRYKEKSVSESAIESAVFGPPDVALIAIK